MAMKKSTSTLYVYIIILAVVLIANFLLLKPYLQTKIDVLNAKKNELTLQNNAYLSALQSKVDFKKKISEKAAELQLLQHSVRAVDQIPMMNILLNAASANGVSILSTSPQSVNNALNPDNKTNPVTGNRYTIKMTGSFLNLQRFFAWVEQYTEATLRIESLSMNKLGNGQFSVDMVIAQYSFTP